MTRGTTNAQALEALDKKFGLGITLVEGADHEESYGMLADGKVDAFATDDVLLYGLIAQHRAQNRFKVVGEFLSYDPYGITFRRNEKVLRDTVERASATSSSPATSARCTTSGSRRACPTASGSTSR